MVLAEIWLKNYPVLRSFKGSHFFLCGPVSSLTLQSLNHVCRFGLHTDVPQDWLGHLPRLQTLRIQTTLFQSKVMTQHLDCWLLACLVQRKSAIIHAWVYNWFRLMQAVTSLCRSKLAALLVQVLRLLRLVTNLPSFILVCIARPLRAAPLALHSFGSRSKG